MPSGQDLLASAHRFYHEPYSTAGGRTSQTSGYKDCSGLCYASLEGVGVHPGGNTVSTSLETWAVTHGGRYISSAEAINTPGAGIAIWGTGAKGHIGLSHGDGRAYETPSAEGHRVGFSPFWRNRWTRFFTWPGIGGPSEGQIGDDVGQVDNISSAAQRQLQMLMHDVLNNRDFNTAELNSIYRQVDSAMAAREIPHHVQEQLKLILHDVLNARGLGRTP